MIRYLFLFMIGACFGSFAECMASRYASFDTYSGRSRCDHCGHKLAFRELVPVFSFLFSKGRCAYCAGKIPASCLLSELFAGIGLCMIAEKCGRGTEFFVYAVFFGVSMFLALCDRKTMTVPAEGLVIFTIAGILWKVRTGPDAQEIFLDVMAGAGWIILCLAESRIFHRESAGIGDGFYLAAAGLGLSGRIAAGGLIAGSMIGIAECVVTRNRRIPFLPSLAEGLFLVWIWKG